MKCIPAAIAIATIFVGATAMAHPGGGGMGGGISSGFPGMGQVDSFPGRGATDSSFPGGTGVRDLGRSDMTDMSSHATHEQGRANAQTTYPGRGEKATFPGQGATEGRFPGGTGVKSSARSTRSSHRHHAVHDAHATAHARTTFPGKGVKTAFPG